MDIVSSSLYTTIGLFGVFVYLVAYTCLQMGLVSGQSYIYASMIIVAAGSILFSLVDNFHLPTAVIQCAFVTISLAGMLRLYITENHVLFTLEEHQFLSSKFPNLPKNLSKRLLDTGVWADRKENSVIAREGEQLDALTYIATGEAKVSVNGTLIGQLGGDSLVGELTVLDDTPATATVILSRPSRCFQIDKNQFRKLALRYPELHAAFAHSSANEMKKRILHRDAELTRPGRAPTAGA